MLNAKETKYYFSQKCIIYPHIVKESILIFNNQIIIFTKVADLFRKRFL